MNVPHLRRYVLVTHRWLGLCSSVFLAVIGVSGTVFLLPAEESTKTFLERFHSTLMIPGAGQSIVIVATIAAMLLELGGLYLWWKRKKWDIRWRAGWRTVSEDIHHASGVILLAVMFLLAGTGVARVATRQVWPQSHVIVKAANYTHTGLRFPVPVQVVYGIGGLGFLVQGVTGVIMWSRRGGGGRRVPAAP